jgi:outer membrane protein assembly factor BamB
MEFARMLSMKPLRLWMTLLIAAGILAACVASPEDELPRPIVVTLPVITATIPGAVPLLGTPVSTGNGSVPPSPAASGGRMEDIRLLWEAPDVLRPASVAIANNRISVILVDGRFLWLDANSGKTTAAAFLWNGLVEGDTVGTTTTDGVIGVASVHQISISPDAGRANTRSRLAVFDVQAHPIWSLPDLEEGQLYSAALASGPGLVVVGRWPYGFKKNALSVYELFTGQKLWQTTDGSNGFQFVTHDGTRIYTILNTKDNIGAIACYDLRTGDLLWRWSDPSVGQIEALAIGDNRVFGISSDRALALDSSTGLLQWMVGLNTVPDAGLAYTSGMLITAPAPSAETGFRPGLVSLQGAAGAAGWSSLGGLLAGPLAANPDSLWVIVRDFDAGTVSLSGLDPATGLERVRIRTNGRPDAAYQIVAAGPRIFLLGDTLSAYGY